mgnify:CR=1 FL=1
MTPARQEKGNADGKRSAEIQQGSQEAEEDQAEDSEEATAGEDAPGNE